MFRCRNPGPKPRYANASWISGNQIFLLPVEPSVGSNNDPSAYEFFAGYDQRKKPVWTRDFARIQHLIDSAVASPSRMFPG